MFLKMTEVNSWCAFSYLTSLSTSSRPCCRSHVTYYFLAASSYVSVGNIARAQELFDHIPALFENMRKIGGKDLPTEVLIRKKSTASCTTTVWRPF